MACGGCKKGSGTRHQGGNGDLTKFAFLTPRQLRLLQQQEAEQAQKKVEEEEGEK